MARGQDRDLLYQMAVSHRVGSSAMTFRRVGPLSERPSALRRLLRRGDGGVMVYNEEWQVTGLDWSFAKRGKGLFRDCREEAGS
jgi:hypothetical protein